MKIKNELYIPKYLEGAEAEKYKGDIKEDVRRMFLADKTAAIMTKKTDREWVAWLKIVKYVYL